MEKIFWRKRINYTFWKNKRVLVTGHTGFKGGWLSHWLYLLSAEVYGFALAPTNTPNFFELTHVEKYLNHTIGDIRNFNTLKTAITNLDPEIIIHMAAQPLVLKSYELPVETIETNILGTAHLLEAARYAKSCKVILVITTDKCYENKEWEWSYRENDRLGGHDIYSSSKACAELITHSFRNAFYGKRNIAIATARAGNVIGGGDWSEYRLIPDIIRAIEREEKLTLRHPLSIRPWQHVLDPLHGYLCLAEKCYGDSKKYSEAWNFGPSDTKNYSVQEIVEKFNTQSIKPVKFEIASDANFKESHYLTLNLDKTSNGLDWSPQYNIDTAIQKTAEWYNAWFNHENMRSFTHRQIVNYQEGILS